MNRSEVLKKIDSLPDALMEALPNIVDQLIESYELGKLASEEAEFTEKELKELDRRYEEIKNDPSASITFEQFKEQMREKHGV